MQGEGQSWAWQPSSVPLLVESKHSPYDPVTQQQDIEVDQKTGLPGAHAQIREELGFVDGSYMLDCLEFRDYGTGHNHVDAISTIEFESFVNDR
jgi:hypothetical protein